MSSSKAYWIYWGACFATVVTWVFAVAAAADDAWVSFNGADRLELGNDCDYSDSICERYDAATAFQFMATIIVSVALVLAVIAAFTPPPTTGVLGLVLGVMLAVFSLFQMIAFSLMAGLVDEFNDSDIKAGPTLGVAVMAWLFGLASTIIILVLRSSVTSDQQGPFRMHKSGEHGTAGGGRAGHNVGAV